MPIIDPHTGEVGNLPTFAPSFPHQQQPSPHSCLPTSFAMVMGIPIAELMAFLGHDDEEGFHVQELLGFAFAKGWSFTQFAFGELELDGKPFRMGAVVPPEWLMQNADGVLTGLYRGKPHAVAWCRNVQKCMDPMGGFLSFGDPSFEPDFFFAGVRHVRPL